MVRDDHSPSRRAGRGAPPYRRRTTQANHGRNERRAPLDALRGVAWPAEFSFRVVKNKLTEEWAEREADAAAAYGSLAAAYAEARARQDLDVAAVVAGECIGLIEDRPKAARIVGLMVTQAQSLLGQGATLDFAGDAARHGARHQ